MIAVETTEKPVIALSEETSFGDLKAALKASEADADPKETTEEASGETEAESSGEAASSQAKPAAVAGSEQQEAKTEEKELPSGVKKRIAEEVRKQSELDEQIREAREVTKGKQKELADLTGESGTAPVKSTAPNSKARPQRPDPDTFTGNLDQFKAALVKHDSDLESYLQDQTRQVVAQEFSKRQASEQLQREWDEAAKEHGADFPALMGELAKSTTPEMQEALSALPKWAAVAVYLAKNEPQRKALVEQFKAGKAGQFAAIAELGVIQSKLTSSSAGKPAVAKKPIPPPLKPVADGSHVDDIDLNEADFSVFKREAKKALAVRS